MKYLLKGLLVIFLIAVLLVAAVTLTSPGLSFLARTISSIASSGESTVEMEGISGIWSGNLSLQRLTLSDREGKWLQVDRINVAWHPFRLFGGTLATDHVNMARVEVLREPLADPNQGSEGETDLPLGLDLQNISISDLVIAEALAGSVAHLGVNASISIKPEPLDAVINFNASRTDDVAGTYDILAVYQPAQRQSELQVTLSEADNGVLSNLFELEDTPPIWFEVTGTGPLEDWQFDAFAKVNDRQVLELDGRLNATGKMHKITLKGVGQPQEFLPPKFRKLVGESFDLDLDVTREETGRVAISTARLDFEKFYLAATGEYNPEGNNQITGGFQTRDNGLNINEEIIPGIKALVPRSVAFSVTGDGKKALADLHVDIPRFETSDITANSIRAHLSARDFNLEELAGNWTLNADAGSIRSSNENFTRALPGTQTLVGNGTLTPEKLTVTNLNFANPVLSADLAANYVVTEKTWDSKFTSEISPSALPENAAKLVGSKLNISGTANGDDAGNLSAKDLVVTGGPLGANGRLDLAADNLAAEFTLDVSSLQNLVEGLDASLQSTLSVNGTPQLPEIEFALESSSLKFNNHTGKDIRLKVEGLASAETPDLNVSLAGSLDGQPITGETRLYTKGNQRVLENLKIENGSNQVTGNLLFDREFIPEGDIDINLPDLASLAALALQEVSGSLKGAASFRNKDNTPFVSLDIEGDQFSFEETQLSGVSISASASDYIKAPKPSGLIKVSRIVNGETRVSNLDLKLGLQQDWTLFDLGTQINDIPLAAKGRVKTGKVIDLEINNANAKVQSIDIALSQTAAIQMRDGQVLLNNVPLRVGGGTIAIKGTVKEALDIKANISNLSAKLVNQFAPDLGASGVVSGAVSVAGKPADPVVNYDLKLSNATTRQVREFGIASLNIASRGKFANKQLSFDASVGGPPGFNINGGGRVKIANATTLDMAYKGDIPFPLLARKLGEQGILLEGAAKLDVKVTGNADRPDIRGNIRSTGGRFVHAESGLAIRNLALNVAMADQKIRIEKMSGELSTGGRITSNGQVDIAPNGNFPADISLKVADGTFTDHKSITSNFDADIRVSGPLVADPTLSGVVNLKRTTVTIPDRLPASIAKLDVKHRNASLDVNKQAENLKPASSSSAGGLRLDLHIKALRKIFIKGRGLDAELGGQLRLTNSISSPRTLGAFEIRRGRLSILGKRLDFTSGEMRFSGSMVPEIQLRAETQRDNYTIIIDVVGPADNPEFRFSSSPALAEDEVLARLVFGRDIGSLSALQIVKLGQAVATLTGHGGNSSLLDKVQGLIQADDIDIKTDEQTGETTVGVGKYINDRVYVGVERGSDAATGKARIDLTIGRGVKLRGEATQNGEGKAGIFYEKDY